jgi:hypothetical protein
MEVIRRNRCQPFKHIIPKTANSLKVKSLKTDVALFSRLYIGCQTRNGNLDEFFQHENQPYPPALADASGRMKHGTKSDLVGCLEQGLKLPVLAPKTSVTILDGAAIVQMLKPQAGATFLQYSQSSFIPYVTNILQRSQRVDVVFDEYIKDSLKSGRSEWFDCRC